MMIIKKHIIYKFIMILIDRTMTDLLLTNFSNQFSEKFLLTIVSLWFDDGNHVYKDSQVLDGKQSIVIYLPAMVFTYKQCVVNYNY